MGLLWVAVPKTYTSTASLLFPGSSGSAGTVSAPPENSGIVAPPVQGGSGSTDQPSLPLMQGVLSVPQPGTSPGTAGLILKSRKTAVHLIKKHKLDREWGLAFEKTVDRFQDRFMCKTGNSGDLRIIFWDRSPRRSRIVVQSAIQELSASVEELSLDPAAKNLDFLRRSHEQAEKDYKAAERALVKFQQEVGGAPPDTQLEASAKLYTDIQGDMVNAEVEASVAESNLARISDVGGKLVQSAQDPAGSDKALLTILYGKLVDRESELAMLRLKFTDKRPEVQQARQAVEVIRRKVDEEIARQLSGLKSGASPFINDAVLTAAKSGARLDGLKKAEKEISSKMRALPGAQAKYLKLQSDLRDERTRLSLVRSEFFKAELIARSRRPQFVVMDPPVLPERPDGYSPAVFIIVGLIAGPSMIMARAGWLWMRQGIKLMSSGG